MSLPTVISTVSCINQDTRGVKWTWSSPDQTYVVTFSSNSSVWHSATVLLSSTPTSYSSMMKSTPWARNKPLGQWIWATGSDKGRWRELRPEAWQGWIIAQCSHQSGNLRILYVLPPRRLGPLKEQCWIYLICWRLGWPWLAICLTSHNCHSFC